jgi:hypothetical protein
VKQGVVRTSGTASLAAASAVIEDDGRHESGIGTAGGAVDRLLEEARQYYRDMLEIENEGMWEWERRLVQNAWKKFIRPGSMLHYPCP